MFIETIYLLAYTNWTKMPVGPNGDVTSKISPPGIQPPFKYATWRFPSKKQISLLSYVSVASCMLDRCLQWWTKATYVVSTLCSKFLETKEPEQLFMCAEL